MTLAPQTLQRTEAIIAIVNNPILPDINTYVSTIISKKPLIQAANLTQETATTLNQISSDHDTMSAAVGSKLFPATLPQAALPVLAIDQDWRRSVVAFGRVPAAPSEFPEP